jgi:phage FluMu protein Com
MPLWRCVNDECDERGFEFGAASNRCPHCKMLRSVELVAVHYLVPAEGPIRTALGNRMIACDPKMKSLPQASGERVAVTCPKCKASEIYAEDERDGVSNHVPIIEQRIEAEQGKK